MLVLEPSTEGPLAAALARHGEGSVALYLIAFVPAYEAVRTFALDRVRAVSLEKDTFTPREQIGDDVFANSLGINSGPAADVDIGFDASVAPYVRARVDRKSTRLNSSHRT